ncbi:MAG: glycosyltransferase family 4 protein [Pseudomonas putida]|jgi:Fuc2NAc and GlcNAc transferase|nr:glycosyltransferase family 4 protein [Pseudomonas putida]
MILEIFLILAFFSSLILTGLLRRYALARSIIDIPNARSSHTVPTPRGGGVAIVITFLACSFLYLFVERDQWQLLTGVIGSGVLISLIGFMDDHGHVAARWRLLGHFCAAIWLLFYLDGGAPLEVFGLKIDTPWVIFAFWTIYLVWLLNLYNFMDGIDGLASIEAITCTLSICTIYWFLGLEHLVILPLLLAVAVLGFLFWNFPPAKIFMGDAGSGFLGIMLGALSLQGGRVSPSIFIVWLILLGVFIVDATYTLLRRILNGDKVYEAHRSHAYQFASRLYGRHLPVTLGVFVINVFWLLPLAFIVAKGWVSGSVGLIVAYLPLIGLAIKYRAGKVE